ncbi:MAG: Trk system potassium transporter TrkA, partial [Clostridia bacterium]|nr:Trk system potassium transporter TrkA [Clostridia bacterium]
MNIVIVGDGKVGHALAEQLSSEGHDIVVIDNSPDRLKNSDTRLDVIAVQGNGVNYSVQLEAGVPKADLLVAATPSDECNMLCCLVAHKLGAKHTIARVRNPEYTQQLVLLREDLGLSMAVNPELATSKEISRILAFPSATKIETFCKGRVELCEFTIPKNSPLHGLVLSSLYGKYRLKVLICTVQRNGKVYIPQGDFMLQAGDHIGITASPAEISAFFKAVDLTREKVRNVFLVGGSRIAYYLTRQLLDMGMQVTLVECNHRRCLELCESFPRAIIIEGDGNDHELLLEEGLGEADAFVALTGNDEANILLSMFASVTGVSKTITKINRSPLLKVTDQLPLDSVVSPKSVATNHILQYVRALNNSRGSNVETLHRLLNDQVEALEFLVTESFDRHSIPLKSLPLEKDLLVASIIRNGKVIIPGGNDTIEIGDSVVVVTTRPYMKDI